MRRIYAFDTAESARSAVQRLRDAGIDEDCLSLIARKDIELEQVPHELLDVSTDIVSAAGRGATIGAATGLFAGIVMMTMPPLGIAVGGTALLALLASGAAVGAWSAALVGAAIPDAVRREFDDEIQAGRLLLVVYAPRSDSTVDGVMAQLNDGHLRWQSEQHAPSAT